MFLTRLCLLSAALSVAAMIANWTIVVRYAVRRERTSLIPFVGGFLGAGAILLWVDGPSHLLWIPLVADPGSLPMVLAAVVGTIVERR